jgi:hypothetical protein
MIERIVARWAFGLTHVALGGRDFQTARGYPRWSRLFRTAVPVLASGSPCLIR